MTALSMDIVPYMYGGREVRTLLIDGDMWFVVIDVCRELGLDNARQAVTRLDPDEVTVITNDGRPLNVCNEQGLYELVWGSRKPQAKAFRRWVKREVLPSIRKTGSYGTLDNLSRLDIARMLVQSEEEKERERARNAQLEAKVAADAPKVIFANSVEASPDSILVRDMAKILKANGVEIGGNRLMALLREEGYLIKANSTDWNSPTQKAMELGLFEIKETAITHSDGRISVRKTTKVTGKGQQYFVNRYVGHAARVAA